MYNYPNDINEINNLKNEQWKKGDVIKVTKYKLGTGADVIINTDNTKLKYLSFLIQDFVYDINDVIIGYKGIFRTYNGVNVVVEASTITLDLKYKGIILCII